MVYGQTRVLENEIHEIIWNFMIETTAQSVGAIEYTDGISAEE